MTLANTTTPDHIATALAAVVDGPKPVTIADIIELVDELAIASSPNPRATLTRPALITLLRDELAPSLGSTGTGRGGGRSIPIDAAGLALWEDVTSRVEALHEDLEGEAPVSGSHEQILLAWSRDLVAADAPRGLKNEYGHTLAGLGQDALDYAHHRVRRIRDLIADHFDPPRVAEIVSAACLACHETAVTLTIDGEDVIAPTIITVRRGNDPLTVHCRHCRTRWSIDDLDLLDRFAWAQKRDERLHDLTTELTADDWHHIRLELRQHAAPKTRTDA